MLFHIQSLVVIWALNLIHLQQIRQKLASLLAISQLISLMRQESQPASYVTVAVARIIALWDTGFDKFSVYQLTNGTES